MKKTVLFLLGLLFSFQSVFCQIEEYEIRAKRIDRPPVIDGILDEEVWQDAPSVSDFKQFEPNKGERVSLETATRILYDKNYIYVAFSAMTLSQTRLYWGHKVETD